ncbi:MAG TPA: hypothetical protein VN774_02775 [Candidatus Limnocylindrales bacterium]|nr:hypothetical protein [Candidatus Limnocylindrales bacterium]
MRGRLMRRTAVFLLGSLLFVPASQVFPPLELDAIQIFVGLIFFIALGLAVLIDRRAHQRGEVELLKRLYFGLLPLPWIVAGLLYCNGKFDTSAQQRVSARVISRFHMPGFLLNSNRLVVTSWRSGHEVERVPVGSFDYGRFRSGDDVFVALQPGALGIPWVIGVFRDDSNHAH